jgi:propanol-preferring alcohol dehydrogenase
MRAVALRQFDAPLVLEERPVPVPAEGQALVRVLATGICHSDLHVVEGRWPHVGLPRVLGHEIVGEDDRLGRVMVYAPWGCGECAFCRRTEEQICPEVAEAGVFQDGGYAEYVLVPSRRFLYPIGDLDPVRTAPLACGGLTPFRAVKRALPWLRAGSTAVVLGAGGLGQFAIQYLRLLTDATVWAGDPAPAKQERARELGAHLAADPSELEGRVDAVLDFVGSDETLARGAALVEQGGLVVLLGLYGGHLRFRMGGVPFEAFFTTSIWGSRDELAELISLAQREELQYTVEAVPLEEAQRAHERLRRGDVQGRIVLVP